MFGAGVLPTTRLPLSVGGYSAGFFALVGVVSVSARRSLLARAARAPHGERRPWGRPWRPGRVAPAWCWSRYAVVAIVVPTHLGPHPAVPVGARWWLLPVVVACVALFLLGARAAGRRVAVAAARWCWRRPLSPILVATLAGLGPAFVLLVLPVLVVQLAWYWAWSLVLRAAGAPDLAGRRRGRDRGGLADRHVDAARHRLTP